ncbi:type II toxin-antitoxin system VapC family toxin [Candidatus Poriferisodalis sp.]|uniref:type II toxin-antitoxin system VapC family toxin n=1 Tax=Candidatus Poriferisodalis sp. TaxID=3101277 RepID=UPI003B5A7376
MAIAYFDASALVKLIVDEPGSEIAEAIWDGCDAAVSSRLAFAEVCAALAAAGRRGDLDETEVVDCEQRWQQIWASVQPVELSERVEQSAGQLARRHRLRGADAVHLASALVLDTADLVVAVWDRRLHDGAVAEHLAVVPATLQRPANN